MEDVVKCEPILLLPDEIMTIILQNLNCRDILNFGLTCKQFNEFINTNQYIWKEKCRDILPNRICDVIEKYGKGNWFDEIKKFFSVKQAVYQELMTMSPKYYWRTSDLCLEDVQNFFNFALSDNVSYHYVIYALQYVIKEGAQYSDDNTVKKPFTMTDVYYAKIIVRFLTQTFLTLRWVQSNIRNELTPDIVLNFFVQWTDPVARHSDEKVKACIDILVDRVKEMFRNDPYNKAKDYTIQEKLEHGLINEKQVLEAVSDVIYKQYQLKIMAGSSLHALDIVKALGNRYGNLIIAAVVYQTVARHCGVHCELIAFPNHLFLEWRNPMQEAPTYKIELDSGELVPQGRCPFAPTAFRREYKYSPDGFLQYVVSAFIMTMGAIKNWYTQNALFLLDFLSNNINDDNPYRDFLPFLQSVNFKNDPELNTHLELEYIPDAYLIVLKNLLKSNSPPLHFTREMEVKKRTPDVKFAVGMLAYQKKYDYLCVVRGWDLRCTTDWRRRVEFKDLEFGSQQPFYSVIAVDQSERYVAQENLIHVNSRPMRLYHLEDVIAKEFSHFDGYCYIPNEEKQKEYPEDEAVRNVYRSRAEQTTARLREESP